MDRKITTEYNIAQGHQVTVVEYTTDKTGYTLPAPIMVIEREGQALHLSGSQINRFIIDLENIRESHGL